MSLSNKPVALVTGGTSGIGKETAVRLAQDGYITVIVGRNDDRGNAAVAEIVQRSRNEHVIYLKADMSLMTNIQRLAETFYASFARLDLLIHSAGVIHTRRMLTQEGLEATFATDYLSRFLLTTLLLDLLKANAPSRIINIAAAGNGMGSINFEDLLGARRIGGMRGLGQAQFANDVFTVELARRLQGTGITVNVLNPGAVDTDIRREFPRLINLILGVLAKPFVMTARQGAEAPYYLATATDVASISGGLFKLKKQVQVSEKTSDPKLGQRLWEVSQQLINQVLPGEDVA